jgi:hypothetical protein
MSETITGITYSELVYDVSVQSSTIEQIQDSYVYSTLSYDVQITVVSDIEQIPEQYTYSQLSYDIQVSTTQPPQPPKQQAIQPSMSLIWIIMIGLLLLLLLAEEKRKRETI